MLDHGPTPAHWLQLIRCHVHIGSRPASASRTSEDERNRVGTQTHARLCGVREGHPRVMEHGDSDQLGAARVARVTQNEVLFRDVNEQIASLNQLGAQLDTFGVVCECGYASCGDVINVHRTVYESVRAQSDRFIVIRGHLISQVENVVEQHDGFVVVDKRDGLPEKIASATDPRG